MSMSSLRKGCWESTRVILDKQYKGPNSLPEEWWLIATSNVDKERLIALPTTWQYVKKKSEIYLKVLELESLLPHDVS